MQKKNETYRDKQLKKQRQLAKSKAKKQSEEGKKTKP